MIVFRTSRSNGNVANKSNQTQVSRQMTDWLTDRPFPKHTRHTHTATTISLTTIATTDTSREKAILFINGHTSNVTIDSFDLFAFRWCTLVCPFLQSRPSTKNIRWHLCRWQKPKIQNRRRPTYAHIFHNRRVDRLSIEMNLNVFFFFCLFLRLFLVLWNFFWNDTRKNSRGGHFDYIHVEPWTVRRG